MISSSERQTCRALGYEAVAAGARKREACECLGINLRRFERWEKQGIDQRCMIDKSPPNRLSELERQRILNVADNFEQLF